jgi:hypothetical protein
VAFFGNIALNSLRRPGAATLVVLAVFIFRVAILGIFAISGSSLNMTLVSRILVIAPAVALDLWYALRMKLTHRYEVARRDPFTRWILSPFVGNLLAVTVFMAVGLPLIPRFIVYPRINAETVPAMILMGAILASWSGWVGAKLGGWLGTLDRPSEIIEVKSGRVVWVSLCALAVLTVLATVFILFSKPPVL